jgi:hypothetical protein
VRLLIAVFNRKPTNTQTPFGIWAFNLMAHWKKSVAGTNNGEWLAW